MSTLMKLVNVRRVYAGDIFSGIAASYVVEPSGITMQLFIPAQAWEITNKFDDDLVAEIRERLDKQLVM